MDNVPFGRLESLAEDGVNLWFGVNHKCSSYCEVSTICSRSGTHNSLQVLRRNESFIARGSVGNWQIDQLCIPPQEYALASAARTGFGLSQPNGRAPATVSRFNSSPDILDSFIEFAASTSLSSP
jgi:hypothetical protein